MPTQFRNLLCKRVAVSGESVNFTAPPCRHAVVAAIFRAGAPGKPAGPRPGAAELLLIERAVKRGDPWSGDVALPGGHQEAADMNLLATAQRETHEEVGLDLANCAEPIGRLESVPVPKLPDRPRLEVIPIVFWWPRAEARLRLEASEVQAAFWASTDSLCAPEAQTRRTLRDAGQSYTLPATAVQGRLVWGLTYGIVRRLLGPPFGSRG